jgi:hypothetical protein
MRNIEAAHIAELDPFELLPETLARIQLRRIRRHALRKPLSGAPEQIHDDLQRLESLRVEGMMWDLTQAEVPFETQFRLLERLRRAAS